MFHFFTKFRYGICVVFFVFLLGFCSVSGKSAALLSGCTPENRAVENQTSVYPAYDAKPDESDFADDADKVIEAVDYLPMTNLNTVNVGHERQLRGAWVATVHNINWPKTSYISINTMKGHIINYLDTMQNTNMNAIFFQARPEADAFYKSNFEPWSRFLTGTQGKAPADGFDPLSYMIEEAHKLGIEVHVWLNPYRAAADVEKTTFASDHVKNTMSNDVLQYGNLLWMDPGSEKVMNHTYNVVMDIVKRYDIDGIHFDDYFYPYAIPGTDFPDERSWNIYKASGGTMERDDWRRDNVNRLIARVYAGIKKEKPYVRFGISPFGIYRPGIPKGIIGRDQYSELFADPLFWLQEGIVDYLAPQLYWPTTSTDQNYDKLLDWWLSINPLKKDVFVGHALYRLKQDNWSADEIRRQLNSIELRKDKKATGSIMYNIEGILANEKNISNILRDEFWKGYALPPSIPGAKDKPALPEISGINGNNVKINPDPKLKGYGLYEDINSRWVFKGLIRPSDNTIALGNGSYAITSISRSGLESKGVAISVPLIIYPDALELNQSDASLSLGGVRKSFLLQPIFTPFNTTEKSLSWRSSNTAVAVVNTSGRVTAVAEGNAVITATTAGGRLEASCRITVENDGVIYGDVNGDGIISVVDAILILRHIVAIKTIPVQLKPLADVNKDDIIGVTDAIIILRYIVGL